MKNAIKLLAVMLFAAVTVGCTDADMASANLSRAADNFEVDRRIVFYNGVTGDYILTIEGKCSLGSGTAAKSLTVTCKTGHSAYKKHMLGLSDNVTYFAEQVKGQGVSVSNYRVTFKPSVIIPSVDLR